MAIIVQVLGKYVMIRYLDPEGFGVRALGFRIIKIPIYPIFYILERD